MGGHLLYRWAGKKERFKLNLKCRDGVWLQNREWELVPKERSLVAEGSTSHPTPTDSRNHRRSCVLGAKWSIWIIWGYELFDIWRGLIVKGFIFEEQDLQFYTELSQCREAMTGVIWSLLLVPVSTRAAALCTSWSFFLQIYCDILIVKSYSIQSRGNK